MHNRPEILAILVPAFPANETETSWVPTQQALVLALQQYYPQVQLYVISLYYPGADTQYTWNGITVCSCNGARNRKLQRPLFWRKVWSKLNAVRKKGRLLGVLSCWCGETALVGRYFARRYALPFYCWICGQDAAASNKMIRYIRPRAGELIALSDFLAGTFENNHGIKPAHVIPNGVRPELFPVPASSQRDIDIAGAGSLSALKRYDLFAEAVNQLRQQFPSLKAVLCGNGSERKKLDLLIQEKHLTNHLQLAGELPHEAVISVMQRCKIFLHTSAYEGFSAACLEALYAGAYVISFCRPMHAAITHWYVVHDLPAMVAKAAELLQLPPYDVDTNRAGFPYTMQHTAAAVMHLFEQG
jgi:glycosyltransferase involved in cell wall biosynthesis